MARQAIIVLAALALALARIFSVKDEIFQAIAHLFVGGLFGAWMVNPRTLYFNAFGSLCIVEVMCFLFDRIL